MEPEGQGGTGEPTIRRAKRNNGPCGRDQEEPGRPSPRRKKQDQKGAGLKRGKCQKDQGQEKRENQDQAGLALCDQGQEEQDDLESQCRTMMLRSNEGLDYSVANREKPYFILGHCA
ncbi:hypothetical protein NDU88_002475 [Pleurodeles waltl]|uniref:Uncharacterized protein n=1 Tax=Pleurodeles waltl TaxID=8319 RepID=A0AAV7Q772_PLEWA|nr:hypothetical protein NDU88_002475 [Pleurodeles waltl]